MPLLNKWFFRPKKKNTPAEWKKVVYIDQWSNQFDADIVPVFTFPVAHMQKPVEAADAVQAFLALTPDQQAKLSSRKASSS